MKFGTLYAYWNTEWDCDYAIYAEIAKKVAEIGFDVLEISADHIYRMPESELQKLNDLAEEYGLILTANSGPSKEYDLASSDPVVRKQGIEYFKTILKKMEIINSKILIGAIYSYWPSDFLETDKEAAWERSIDCLKEISKTAEELEIEISLEVLNRNETYILTDCKEAIEYCNKVGSKNVKILLDTYHMNIEEDNIPDAIKMAGDLLGHLHVGECNRKLPGMNNSIDWDGIGEALKDINYDKAVVMEPFLLKGGSVGEDIRVWRDLSDNADQATMDKYITDSLRFLKKTLE
ncbi:TIM barrel protein [Iocasia frigidifontis]|uniref:TIM barrel protein n=1 Tax=Iocasia fonsfrigidae TaxID=2682810 RepID=A0A8A7KFR2_9FIRM|nr:sugar phosphate isomerase/epimerase [Iocasia fonsfrigidae]QTL97727.1 TIM barrel protein [Iocasia fonsfrigidae]